MARSRGFTLIELLLATAILATGLAIAFAALRTAGATVSSAEAMIERTERVRIVQQFLRRQFGNVLPLAFARDERTGQGIVFEGGRDGLRFVAPMPGYLSRGGPHLQSLRLAPGADGQRLEFEHVLLVGDELIEPDEPRPPVVLLDGIAEARFAYRTLDERGELADWTDTWEDAGQLPLLVRIELRFTDERMRWATLETPLPLGFGRVAAPAVVAPPPRRGGQR
ncbi:prepilin-type N-terminal cleavage/methylation domain-containing protein [Rehaibacterium terrae]|uniref:General secretion pathway protein J n=1 Tax=Rehaibacterium terrae TaxID=1341696 RepID=A0A7W7XXS4_9GAMM|nr:prepilin-type N-terminal cleavage/methylation domain-containing protein [Rehaibacterium terrae]MBB5014511.1 general secretion pathway protein J [Rehaibacterium terrae]